MPRSKEWVIAQAGLTDIQDAIRCGTYASLCPNNRITKRLAKERDTHRRELDVGIIVGLDERARQREAAAEDDRRDEDPASSVHRRRYRAVTCVQRRAENLAHVDILYVSTAERAGDPRRAITPRRLPARLLPSSRSRPSGNPTLTRRMESKLAVSLAKLVNRRRNDFHFPELRESREQRVSSRSRGRVCHSSRERRGAADPLRKSPQSPKLKTIYFFKINIKPENVEIKHLNVKK